MIFFPIAQVCVLFGSTVQISIGNGPGKEATHFGQYTMQVSASAVLGCTAVADVGFEKGGSSVHWIAILGEAKY